MTRGRVMAMVGMVACALLVSWISFTASPDAETGAIIGVAVLCATFFSVLPLIMGGRAKKRG